MAPTSLLSCFNIFPNSLFSTSSFYKNIILYKCCPESVLTIHVLFTQIRPLLIFCDIQRLTRIYIMFYFPEPFENKLQTSCLFTHKYFNVLSPKNKGILLHNHNLISNLRNYNAIIKHIVHIQVVHFPNTVLHGVPAPIQDPIQDHAWHSVVRFL